MRLRTLFAAAVAILFTTGSQLAAQTGTLTGRVLADDGSPIVGAQLSLTGTGLGGLTNARGAFLLLRVPTGSHELQIESLGYSSAQVSVTIRAGETSSHTVRLSQTAVTLEGVAVTVGSRSAHTAAEELPVPVDVYTADEIQLASPQMEMGNILQELSPAIYMPRPQIADLTSGVRPFQLRGMSPDHSLVLVNGKRRHPTAIIHVFGAGSGGSGSSGVDMNAIVPSAVGGMEILRDGAAAQYGSDAIAGVINVRLRDDVHRPQFNAVLGQYRPTNFDPDGERLELSGSSGFEIGDRGVLVVSGMYSDRAKTDRAGPDGRDQIVAGDANEVADIDGDGINEIVTQNNAVDMPNHVIGDGETTNQGGFVNFTYDLDENRIHQGYAFGGYTFRRDISSGFFRRGIDSRNWPQVHPMGFLPKFRGETSDLMAVGGVQGYAGDFSYDVSLEFGRNRLDTDIFDTHNVSLGPCLDLQCSNAPGFTLAPGADGILGTADDPGIANKTDVYAGAMVLNQTILQTDWSRGVDIGAFSPLNVAFGASARFDSYEIIAGEEASYVNGYHPDRSGGTAAVGSQVFTGYRPDQSGSWGRNNVGLYVDLESELTEQFLLAAAGRFERYSDFGNTLTGKVAARLKPSEQFILRAAASTGFRAPNLNQSHYAHVSTGFRDDGMGGQEAYEIGEIPVDSDEARALGAEPLEEERSINLSAGFAFSPTDQLTFTADVYQIEVDDRIILTGTLSGPTVETLLAAFGAPTVKFFTNSVDTRTRGIDFTARYRHLLTSGSYLEFLAQYNRNSLEVTNVSIPDVISELEDQVFDSGDEYSLENGRPKDRATIRTRFINGPMTLGISGNYWGLQQFRLEEGVGGSPDVFLDNGPHLILDGEASYEFAERFTLGIGVENLLGKEPAVRPDGYNFGGIFPYYSSSGVSMNGRYIYSRISVKF